MSENINNKDLRLCTRFLAQLCTHAINATAPAAVPASLNERLFIGLCVNHKLENIAYTALSATGSVPFTEDAWFFLGEKYKQGILNDASQHYYLDMLRDAFNENGLSFLVLKGMCIKGIYPSSDLRQCSDIDIYVGKEGAKKAYDLLTGMGFTNSIYGFDTATDNYKLDKFSYTEIHKQLICDPYPWKDECNKITERLIPLDGHELKMSDEDFYLFMLCHIAKHAKVGGIGMRAVLDVWVYERAYPDLDRAYIRDKLEKCGLSMFYDRLLRLMHYWFDGAQADTLTLQFADYVAISGWDGLKLQWRASDIDRNYDNTTSKLRLKARAYYKMAFPGFDVLRGSYPVLEKHKLLLPLCYAHRAVKGVLFKPQTIKHVSQTYDEVDLSETDRINRFRRELGL